MSTSVILLSVLLFITCGRAWNDGPDWNPWNDINPRYPEPYYDFHQPDQPFADVDFYPEYHSEGRTRPQSTPAHYPLFKNDEVDNKGNSRFIGTAFLASVLQPFPNLANRLPFIANPNFVGPVRRIYNCNGTSGETGVCASRLGCSLSGGEPKGSCPFPLGVCCINSIKTCDGTAAINNTYWKPPVTSDTTTCTLTVAPVTLPAVQPKPICQIRLDFDSFTIGQPTAGVCLDAFSVEGAVINQVPTICGENKGQHMYLEIPPTSATTASSSGVVLALNFDKTITITRKMSIKISFLPCGASYLAPENCLQYFTSKEGSVKSFNWHDVPVAEMGQLNDQDYNICFRTELFDTEKANQITYSVCDPVVGDAFLITGTTATEPSNSGTGSAIPGCLTDFLLIDNGFQANDHADRYCGGELNPIAATAAPSVKVSSKVKPFRITYITDADETTAGDVANIGFCLSFQEEFIP